MFKFPCENQTVDEIAAYYKKAKAGDCAVIRDTRFNHLEYTMTTVERVDPKTGRVYVKAASSCAAFHAKSGKNCFHPKGQVSLVVPTDAVLGWATANPRGRSQFSMFNKG
jgi:hypothetical protein